MAMAYYGLTNGACGERHLVILDFEIMDRMGAEKVRAGGGMTAQGDWRLLRGAWRAGGRYKPY